MRIVLCLVILFCVGWLWSADINAQPSSTGVGVSVDPETGCEYVRGASGITPRMEGVGVNYRHKGCRQLIERI
jgi:hypothetical protein